MHYDLALPVQDSPPPSFFFLLLLSLYSRACPNIASSHKLSYPLNISCCSLTSHFIRSSQFFSSASPHTKVAQLLLRYGFQKNQTHVGDIKKKKKMHLFGLPQEQKDKDMSRKVHNLWADLYMTTKLSSNGEVLMKCS